MFSHKRFKLNINRFKTSANIEFVNLKLQGLIIKVRASGHGGASAPTINDNLYLKN